MICYVKSRSFLGLPLIPEPFTGYAVGPIAFILESHRGDTGLRAHEQQHIDDFWSAPWGTIKGWLTRDREWRLRSEVRAYVAQILDPCNPIPIYQAAQFLSERYGLGIEECDAYLLLRERIFKVSRGVS